MPLYQCKHCSYTTRKRHIILRHLQNKNPCRNRVIRCDIDTFYSDYLNEPVDSNDEDDDFDINSEFTDCTLLDEVFQIIDDDE